MKRIIEAIHSDNHHVRRMSNSPFRSLHLVHWCWRGRGCNDVFQEEVGRALLIALSRLSDALISIRCQAKFCLLLGQDEPGGFGTISARKCQLPIETCRISSAAVTVVSPGSSWDLVGWNLLKLNPELCRSCPPTAQSTALRHRWLKRETMQNPCKAIFLRQGLLLRYL